MKKKILVVGQTPPPYGGQAIMIQYMLDASYSDIELYHVRMCFSKQFNDLGHTQFQKFYHLLEVIVNVWIIKFKYNINTLYYPLSGATNISLLRDFLILVCTRFLFNKTIYHFHAAGISNNLPKQTYIIRKLCYLVFKKPDLSITSSEYNPKDAEYLQSKTVKIIPLGIPDQNITERRNYVRYHKELNILFMGLLNRTKGEGYVLEAVHKVCKTGRKVNFHIAGCFASKDYQADFFAKIAEYGLNNNVIYHGVVTGDDKQKLFLSSDVFCFPSFFLFESFGIVLLEGLMYQMPLIASRWRGIQSIVEDGVNGYLVDVKNSDQIAECLIKFYDNPSLLEKMARKGRNIFKDKYEISRYLNNIELALSNV